MGQTAPSPRSKDYSDNRPPSRVRYEEAHPTVSCRVPKAVYDRLRAVRLSQGKSFADVLKVGLGILEPKVQAADDAAQEGYSDGFEDAEAAYKVTFPCAVCGQMIEVADEESKKAAARYMVEHGWGHCACDEKQRRGPARPVVPPGA